ncbi:MAG: sodium:proton antiporter [Verrucomicrobiota bacterium]
MILPFVLLLATIAGGPLLFPDWWSKHYAKVAIGLGAVTLGYYSFGFDGKAEFAARHKALETGHEYLSFISLIGALYVVSGGIHIKVKGEATPFNNVLFLLVGAVISNVLGTTGASMLLIRPWLRLNKYRVTGHHVVFFIFIVSNVGGCLTPIGDPPLFLGYLKGIPFWWVAEHCWPIWATGLALLLGMFYFVDRKNYLRAAKTVREKIAEPPDVWRFEGLVNILFLAVILGAVFVEQPGFARETLMLSAAIGSYLTTKKSVHAANHFNFHPIQEVAILFIGIFATMMPALDWLQNNAQLVLGKNPSPSLFYWGSGTLSSVLDNAPTYLSFLTAIFGSLIDHDTISQVQQFVLNGGDLSSLAEPARHTQEALQKYFAAPLAAKAVSVEQIEIAFLLGNIQLNNFILAISVGSVFFGANTYIGNGPNFMVKSIADQQKVHAPHFLEYIYKWALPFMVPMLAIVWWIFFRN